MASEDFIINNEDSFLIRRKIKGKYYDFGDFSTLKEAQNECEKLDKNGWPIKINHPKYQDFYNPPKIDTKEIKNLNNFLNLHLIKISVKLNKTIKKWYVELVYHENIFKFGLFNSEIEADEFITKILINGSITKEIILTIWDYTSIDDFKNDSKVKVSYDINEDKFNVQLINNDHILILGSYFAENQAENVKNDYLKYLNKISCFKIINKKDFIHFADEKLGYYNNLKIENTGEIGSSNCEISLNFQRLNEMVNDFNDLYLTIPELSKKYNVTEYEIKKIIYNYESGNFDKIIEDWEQKQSLNDSKKPLNLFDDKSLQEFDDSIRERPKISENLNKPYKILKITKKGSLKEKSSVLSFSIFDAKNIHENYNEGEEINVLAKKYFCSPENIERIIVRYDAGDFDKFLKEVLVNNPSDEGSILKVHNNNPFIHLTMDDNSNIFFDLNNSNQLTPLNLDLNDIKLIFEEYKNNRSIKSLSTHFNINYDFMDRIINRIIAGDFDEIQLIQNEEKIKIDSFNKDNLNIEKPKTLKSNKDPIFDLNEVIQSRNNKHFNDADLLKSKDDEISIFKAKLKNLAIINNGLKRENELLKIELNKQYEIISNLKKEKK